MTRKEAIESIRRQVELLNVLIKEAIYHGADSGGAYYSNRWGLGEAIEKYLYDQDLYPLTKVYWHDNEDPLIVVNVLYVTDIDIYIRNRGLKVE